MNIGPGHWIFALVFVIGFIFLMFFAYKDDIKKSPHYFRGSWKIALIVIGSIMVLVVIKILLRISGYQF
jgi:heme/copper-type cytochrome/quinol oxidase subunit 2